MTKLVKLFSSYQHELFIRLLKRNPSILQFYGRLLKFRPKIWKHLCKNIDFEEFHKPNFKTENSAKS